MSVASFFPQAVRDAVKSTATAARDAAKNSTAKHALKSAPRTAPDAARRSNTSDAAAAQTPQTRLLNFFYDPHAKPINFTTFEATKQIAQDPSHPFHIRTQRRLAAFDPSILRWRVHVPYEVTKKSAIRNWAKKRIIRALNAELEVRGLERDGRVKDEKAAGDHEDCGREKEYGEREQGLRGALLVILPKDPKIALPFSDEEAAESASRILEQVQRMQKTGRGKFPLTAVQRQQRAVANP